MTEYNRKYYSDRIQTPTPGHQPIYGQVPFNWITNLEKQVAPRNLKDPGTASPLLIGVASKSGAIIESYWVGSLAERTTSGGGGYGGGGANSSVDYGYGTEADPTYIHIYTRREPDDAVYFLFSINLFAASFGTRYATGRMGFPILPQPEQAWRLEPGQEIYVALSKPVAAPGMNMIILGMHYS
jgi:hypothetical protein